jgi:23S rRNA-/tRNA-specific pseudouridylate synthase
VAIRTGITHQIRCQLAHAGYPIVGDKVYGNRELDRKLGVAAGTHFLHAERITFVHPATGKAHKIRVALPRDFDFAVRELSLELKGAMR